MFWVRLNGGSEWCGSGVWGMDLGDGLSFGKIVS